MNGRLSFSLLLSALFAFGMCWLSLTGVAAQAPTQKPPPKEVEEDAKAKKTTPTKPADAPKSAEAAKPVEAPPVAKPGAYQSEGPFNLEQEAAKAEHPAL